MIDLDLLRLLARPLLDGAIFSVLFTLAVCLIGGLLAILTSYAALNGSTLTRRTIETCSLVTRGFPLIVLLYFVYYGFGSLSIVRDTWLWVAFASPLFCALVAFSLNHTFFVGQILTGALRNLPQGMNEASFALGLSRAVTFATVQFPLAFRLALPAYRNEFVLYFKSSSLVTVVTLNDILSVAKTSADQFYDPITPFFGAACIYWLLVQVIQVSFDVLERRMARHGF